MCESDYSIIMETEIGHATITPATSYFESLYASTNSFLITVKTNIYPGWSLDSNYDFIVISLELDGSAV